MIIIAYVENIDHSSYFIKMRFTNIDTLGRTLNNILSLFPYSIKYSVYFVIVIYFFTRDFAACPTSSRAFSRFRCISAF